ncbi:carbon-nitrogen hydrolase family protein [Chitinophagaceae bacterium MMS25-I14]
MKIALAAPPIPASLNDGLDFLRQSVTEAAADGAGIICFPESFLPGYPGMGYTQEDQRKERLTDALNQVCRIAAENNMAIIVPMDWHGDNGLLNTAHVISDKGEVLGYQAKVQLDPSEDTTWIPGNERRIFEVNGVKFGISICHEGFRYPETVRWAARNGASIVFHPHFAGSNTEGVLPTEWGSMKNPYYEKAMMMRALENTIYFASVNYTTRYPESASSVIAPDGTCIVHAAYGAPGIVTAIIDPALATGMLAKRFKPALY